MKNPHKALEAIERLVGGDFGLDMEWYIHDDRVKRKNKRLLEAAKIITEIYLIAHAEGHCGGHTNWQDRKYEILQQPDF
jgi:hypothetical protein